MKRGAGYNWAHRSVRENRTGARPAPACDDCRRARPGTYYSHTSNRYVDTTICEAGQSVPVQTRANIDARTCPEFREAPVGPCCRCLVEIETPLWKHPHWSQARGNWGFPVPVCSPACADALQAAYEAALVLRALAEGE